jgi:hypothetical protein
MKHLVTSVIVLLSLVLQPVGLKAQSTYAQVYQLLNTHCGASNSNCHNGGTPTFNITVSQDSLYHELINGTPLNPAAVAVFNSLVAPGDVQRSFLLRKIAHGISDGLKLNQPAEGVDMPNGQPALANNEIELVRQWILHGAPETGEVIDTAMINTFYRNGGITDTYSPHDVPTGSAFQIYVGTVFVAPDSDNEYYIKYNPHITAATEAYELKFMAAAATHHFTLYNFQAGHDVYFPWGLRPISETSMNDVSAGLGASAGLMDYVLPPNTAYFYDAGAMCDIDYHIVNPSSDSILATDIYINVYTQPLGTSQHYINMFNFENDSMSVPQDANVYTYTSAGYDTTQTNYYKIWKLYSHTHKYGVGFDIWLRNPDGSKGAQIYDGNYSYEEGFDVGYYRWGNHVTVRTFPGDSLFQVDPRLGFIYEASYTNTAGPNPVLEGTTAAQEMDIAGFYGYLGDPLPTAISTVPQEQTSIKIFPNPIADEFVIQYELAQDQPVQIDLHDVAGNKISNLLSNTNQVAGKYTLGLHTDQYHLAAGVYLVSINIGGKISTQKLVITD